MPVDACTNRAEPEGLGSLWIDVSCVGYIPFKKKKKKRRKKEKVTWSCTRRPHTIKGKNRLEVREEVIKKMWPGHVPERPPQKKKKKKKKGKIYLLYHTAFEIDCLYIHVFYYVWGYKRKSFKNVWPGHVPERPPTKNKQKQKQKTQSHTILSRYGSDGKLVEISKCIQLHSCA